MRGDGQASASPSFSHTWTICALKPVRFVDGGCQYLLAPGPWALGPACVRVRNLSLTCIVCSGDSSRCPASCTGRIALHGVMRERCVHLVARLIGSPELRSRLERYCDVVLTIGTFMSGIDAIKAMVNVFVEVFEQMTCNKLKIEFAWACEKCKTC